MSRGDDRPAAAVRRVVAAVLLLVAVVGPWSATASAAGVRQDAEQTTTTAPDRPGIIPEPNSGEEPEDAGDRGGALQTVLFGLMLLGVVAIGFFVYRESRKARERRGF